MNSKRKEWIDALRAVAIIMVVYGHQVPEFDGYFVVTSPVKMPLFFLISGYLFSMKSQRSFYKKVLLTLIVPWLFLGLLPQILMTPSEGLSSLVAYVLKMLSGKVIWFMPCFIIGSLLFYYTYALMRNRLIVGGCISAFFFIVGVTASHYHILDFSMVNTAMAVQPYFFAGFLFKQIEGQAFVSGCSSIVVSGILFVVFVSLAFILFPGQSMDVHLSSYYNYPLCFAQTLTGLLFFVLLFRKIENFPSWVTVIGKASLVIYIWHSWAIIVFNKSIAIIDKNMPSYVYACLSSLAGILICVILYKFISKYVPFMIGNR